MIIHILNDDGTSAFNTKVPDGPMTFWVEYMQPGTRTILGVLTPPRRVVKSWDVKGSIMNQTERPLPNNGVKAGNDDVLEAYDEQS